MDTDTLLNAVHDKQLIQFRKDLAEARQQNSLFMYRLMHIIEVASLTRESNPAMQEIMAIAAGKNDAEMIEKGIV
jgi:hypothetical protein